MAPAKTFPELVRWAAETYHGGVMYQLAIRVGISPALADRWSKGLVQRPTIETVLKFCRAYDLDPAAVLTLSGVSVGRGPVSHRRALPVAGDRAGHGHGRARLGPAAPARHAPASDAAPPDH
jgi:Cro/C1-type HTH DNA-binding domain